MKLFSDRLPAVLTRADLAHLLTPTFARETGASEELALDRMKRAVEVWHIADSLYGAVSEALTAAQGSRSVDEVIDKLSRAVARKRDSLKAAPKGPALAAFMVLVNLELGLSKEEMRAMLESDMGRELLEQGYRALGEYLVDQLVPRPRS